MAETLTGTGVVPGIAVGPAFPWCRAALAATGMPAGSHHEHSRLDGALRATRQQLLEVIRNVAQHVGAAEARILRSQLALLGDPLLLDEVKQEIDRGTSAAVAAQRAVSLLAGKLEALRTPRLRDRAADLRDVGNRLAQNLFSTASPSGLEVAEGVLCAPDLGPSEIVCLDRQKVVGIALEAGAAASHTVILARSLGIPTVVGTKGLLSRLKEGDCVVLDGATGEVVVCPDEKTIRLYRGRLPARQRSGARTSPTKARPAVTRDGYRVALGANIGSPAEVHGAIAGGAEGIGLFRTEFLFLNRDTAPSEEEQFAAYREALAAMAPGRVVIRTADMGGDKEAPFLKLQPEPNPALGLRGIRLSLRREAFFRSQVRAMLRASHSGNLAILLPMITDISEVRSARVIINEIAREIRGKGEKTAELIPIGVMIETPAAALTAEGLALEADFFSIGTNDLTQYVLAADRLNEQVSYLYQPLHPAVLRLMHEAAQAAARNGKPLGVCGELAGDPGAAAVFIGLGVTELSMSPERIAPVRGVIGRISRHEAVASLPEALASKDGRESVERLGR